MIACLLPALLLSGCATSRLETARANYYQNQLDRAALALDTSSGGNRNRVLTFMERGMIHHTRGDYAKATTDWLEANAHIRDLDYLSVSESTTSLIINDTTQTYTGAPFERSLLHAFTALNYFALAEWHEAAVEARLIADGLESLNGFPDDPYSRYVAGVAFEMIRDFNGARLEYTRANALATHLTIAPQSGHIGPVSTNQPPPSTTQSTTDELICFVSIGRAPPAGKSSPRHNATWGSRPYAEILHNGKCIGRSYTLNTTGNLMAATQKRIAALKAAKTATRIILKESIANAVAEENTFLGEVLRLILYALETPDTRSWQTLPMWLQVARIPCPPDIQNITVVFRNTAGTPLKRAPLTTPLHTRDHKHITLIRAW